MTKDFDIRRYTIRLTKSGLKAPVTKRTHRALVTIKQFLEKHTRAERGTILIGEELNSKIWEKGRKNPPAKVKVFAQKLKDGKVFVNLEGTPLKIEKVKEEKKKEEKKESLEELTDETKKENEKKVDKDNTPSKKKKE